MINSDGIIGATLQWLFNDPELSLKASPVLSWLTLITYGTWHMAPFASWSSMPACRPCRWTRWNPP